MILTAKLIGLGLERALSWEQAEELLDLAGAEEQARAALERLLTAPRRSQGPDWSVTERDVAFALALRDLLGLPDTEASADWRSVLAPTWDGATPEEAFRFGLRTKSNPGDGSGVAGLTTEVLHAERQLIAVWSSELTRWVERRQLQVDYELRERKQRGIARA